MRTLQYAEEARRCPRLPLEQSTDLIQIACVASAASTDAANATAFANDLWAQLVQDLADDNDGRAHEPRAQIVTVGTWTLREFESIRGSRSKSFDDVITVAHAIKDGLL